MQAKTFWLKTAWFVLTTLSVVAGLACLVIFLDFAQPRWPRASFGGFRREAILDFALGSFTIALVGAAMHVNARRIARGAGGWRFIAAFIGAAATLALLFSLSGVWLILGALFESPQSANLASLVLGACVLPLIGCLGALGVSGLQICFARERPEFEAVLRVFAMALPGFTAAATAASCVAIARQTNVGSALFVGTPAVLGLGALTFALMFNLRRESSWQDVARSIAGLILGLLAIAIMSGVLHNFLQPQDPRALFLGIIFLGPLVVGAVPFFLIALLITTGRTKVSAWLNRAIA